MRIRQVVIDSNDPRPLADFWSFATGREVTGDSEPYLTLEDPEGRDVTLLIQQVDDDIKSGKNPVHIDLFASDPEAEADRLVTRGARRVATRDPGHKVIILDDPQGNVFCVIDPASG
jgi:Glyoxalase-like domain